MQINIIDFLNCNFEVDSGEKNDFFGEMMIQFELYGLCSQRMAFFEKIDENDFLKVNFVCVLSSP